MTPEHVTYVFEVVCVFGGVCGALAIFPFAFALGKRLKRQHERTNEAYAIEHGEYLAQSVEHFQDAKNAFAEYMETPRMDDNADRIDALLSDCVEAWRGMHGCVYEFRKRAARCR